MASDHFRFSAGEGRILSQHRLGDGAMQVWPPSLEKRSIRRVLDQRMVKDDPDRFAAPMFAGEARLAQATQASVNTRMVGRDHAQHVRGELAADDAADLSELLRVAELIEPRHQ